MPNLLTSSVTELGAYSGNIPLWTKCGEAEPGWNRWVLFLKAKTPEWFWTSKYEPEQPTS